MVGQPLIIVSYLSLCFYKKGLKRSSVFERLGAESKADEANGTEVRSVSCDHLCSL